VHADGIEEAKRLAKSAATHYALAQFDLAADEYSKSYEASPSPGLLFNLGQCQMMLKSYERAVFFFEGYLRDKPDAPNVALTQDLIAEAKRELAAAAAREQAFREAQRRAAARPQVQPPPPRRGNPHLRLPAFAVVATGALLGGVALYLGLHADNVHQLAVLTDTGPQHEDFKRDARNTTIAAATVGGVGGAALIAGGVLTYFGWCKKQRVQVTPAGGASAAGFIASGSF
jgi:tetratricopeptide (TPR) repeat protein